MKNNLHFKNGRFRILQLTDMQDIQFTSHDTVKLIEELINISKPDFIICTGDQIKGYSPTLQCGDMQANVAKTICNLFAPIEKNGIPFSVVFGNHDENEKATKDFQWDCYKCFENFIGENYTNDFFPVYSEDDKDVPFGVYSFDSFGKNSNGALKIITTQQVDFYKKTRDEYSKKYGHDVKALAFQHIPPAEIYDCLKRVPNGTKNALQGAGKFAKFSYMLPDYAKNSSSFMGENAASPDTKSSQLNAFCEKHDVLGLFFGHDHRNSFIVNYNGVDLGYTQSCGFNSYGPGLNRGGRIFDIYEDNPNEYKTFTLTYKNMLGNKTENPVSQFVYSHSPSSVSEAKKLIKKVIYTTVAVAIPARIIIKKSRKL